MLMTNVQIKKAVKELTGYQWIAVRKGTGSMNGLINIHSDINKSQRLKPFEKELRDLFTVEIISEYTVSIKDTNGKYNYYN